MIKEPEQKKEKTDMQSFIHDKIEYLKFCAKVH